MQATVVEMNPTAVGKPPSGGRDAEVKTLKELLQQLIDAGEITQSQVGREAGLSSSAISQWLKDKYGGDNGALEQKLQIWWESREIRTRTSNTLPSAPQYVPTPTSRKILAVFSYAQMAQDLAVVYGGAGTGKTSSAKQYQRSNPSVWLATMKPDTASVVTCLEEVADAVGLRNLPGMGAARMRREIVAKIRHSAGLLIVDEAQHLSVAALEELRSIHDEVEVGLVLQGNELIYSRLTGKTRAANFAQLFSRIGKRLRLNRPSNGDVDTLMAAFKLTGRPEHELLSQIASKPGALRGVVKSLRLGAMLAAGGGTAIALSHIREAWRDLGGEE